MSLSSDNQKGVENLVDKYKKDGRFDEVRRKHLAEISADVESFTKLCAEAERLVDDVLASRSMYLTKNEVREKLLRELNSRFRKRCEAIVFQRIGTDDSIMTLLSDIRPRVEAYLGMSGDEASDDVHHMEENHQVCDMEIDSDTEQGTSGIENIQQHHQNDQQQMHTLAEIQLPPSTRLASCNSHPTRSPNTSSAHRPTWNLNSPNRGGGAWNTGQSYTNASALKLLDEFI
ncbi:unnamed protein product [Anisakis simplex]|uniref:BOD1/SHG1 domain-containing protein n=1 Tax=Anisakis simplex TaxID=6269 RepID=A0A0M3K523_ANISI|nr:unnamed protein product [Anisakis simplex]